LERPGDVRKALVGTSNGKIGNALDQALLYCFQYDPATNSYVADAWQFTIYHRHLRRRPNGRSARWHVVSRTPKCCQTRRR
jgi:hypothetical protein